MIMRTFFLIVLVSALPAAADPAALKGFQEQQEARARAEASDLLSSLCPRQCVLLSVEDISATIAVDFGCSGHGCM